MKETELSVFKTDHLILSTDSSIFKIGPREEDIGRSVFSSQSSVFKNERIVSFTGLSEENTEQSFLKEERREEETLLWHRKIVGILAAMIRQQV
jgi:hypothetical protein